MGLGAAVLAGSLAMDRLADQDVPPFAAPGLLPGLLGLALLAGGGVLLARGRRPGPATGPAETATWQRPALVIALCVLFGAGLVGRGLPFWLAAALFVATAILLLQPPEPGRPRFAPRNLLLAATVGLGAGAAVTLVFQFLFLVRLP